MPSKSFLQLSLDTVITHPHFLLMQNLSPNQQWYQKPESLTTPYGITGQERVNWRVSILRIDRNCQSILGSYLPNIHICFDFIHISGENVYILDQHFLYWYAYHAAGGSRTCCGKRVSRLKKGDVWEYNLVWAISADDLYSMLPFGLHNTDMTMPGPWV